MVVVVVVGPLMAKAILWLYDALVDDDDGDDDYDFRRTLSTTHKTEWNEQLGKGTSYQKI